MDSVGFNKPVNNPFICVVTSAVLPVTPVKVAMDPKSSWYDTFNDFPNGNSGCIDAANSL